MLRPYTRRYLEPNQMKERKYGDFEYVVFERPPPKVAFGSGVARTTLPTCGAALTGFMRLHTAELHPAVAPCTYDSPLGTAFYRTLNKPGSVCGVGARSARFQSPRRHQPPPRAPPPPPAPHKQCRAPFNTTLRRRARLDNDTPAPCDYSTAPYSPRKMRFTGSFNGKRTLRCVVEIKCVPYNMDACAVCDELCGPRGDYWHYENRIFLCRKHYARLYKGALAKFQGLQLSEFKSIRDCFFAHLHNSCTASVKLLTPEQILKKLRKEAYLDLYFPQRRNFL